jgi:cyclophilin family peptidyl-prolyl cis-trans isomerase
MIQGGCPKGNGSGNPGYFIPFEASTLKHTRGVLSMARQGGAKNSAGSQFFIMHANNAGLDNQYTSFGVLVEGDDILEAIANVPVSANPEGEISIPKKVPALVTVGAVLLHPSKKGK